MKNKRPQIANEPTVPFRINVISDITSEKFDNIRLENVIQSKY